MVTQNEQAYRAIRYDLDRDPIATAPIRALRARVPALVAADRAARAVAGDVALRAQTDACNTIRTLRSAAMPPERAWRNQAALGAWSDVVALAGACPNPPRVTPEMFE